MCAHRTSLSGWNSLSISERGFWYWVYFSITGLGDLAPCAWASVESACLLIEWTRWSVIEMRLRQTGGLLVSQTRRVETPDNVLSVNVYKPKHFCTEEFLTLVLKLLQYSNKQITVNICLTDKQQPLFMCYQIYVSQFESLSSLTNTPNKPTNHLSLLSRLCRAWQHTHCCRTTRSKIVTWVCDK